MAQPAGFQSHPPDGEAWSRTGGAGRGSRMKKKSRLFFARQTEQSRVKAAIITKYFWSRMRVMSGTAAKMVYLDLYAGRGDYEDGAESTPLLVLRRAIEDPLIGKSLVAMFNDKDHASALRTAIKNLPGIEQLAHKPTVYSSEVDASTPEIFEKIDMAPTLAFLDPWGYKGLSRELIQALLKGWGSEVLFFFNFNRVNMDITNESVTEHMEALFGPERLDSLRDGVDTVEGTARERVVMAALAEMTREAGGKLFLPFRFVARDAERTSHYLVFVTKNFLGYKIMRDVMGGASSYDSSDGVPSFEYTSKPPLFLADGRGIEALAASLMTDMAGESLTVDEVFQRHSPGKLYVMTNYREALLRLEEEDRATMDPPAKNRRLYKGRPSLPSDVLVTFPRRPRTAVR